MLKDLKLKHGYSEQLLCKRASSREHKLLSNQCVHIHTRAFNFLLCTVLDTYVNTLSSECYTQTDLLNLLFGWKVADWAK